MRQVGFICQWFPPEPVTLPAEFVRGLADARWTVRVLTGFPNYPTGLLHVGYRFPWPRMDSFEGTQTLRTPLYPSHDRSALPRMANYLSWAATATLGAIGWLRHADVNLVYGSPVTAALPALGAKALGRVPFVIQVQDLWPDSVTASGMLHLPRGLSALSERVCNWIYRQAALCLVISPSMVDVLVARGVDRANIRLIPNWTDERTFKPVTRTGTLRTSLGIHESERIAMYAGNLGPAQGLDRWIEAMREVEGCHLVLVGDGIERSRLETIADGSRRVHFLGPVPPHKVPGLIADADAQVVSLTDQPLFRVTMPSKVQTALACGSPLLVSVNGDAADVVRKAKAGLTIKAGDVTAIRRALMRFRNATDAELESWSRNALAYYRVTMSRETGLAALGQALEDVAATRALRNAQFKRGRNPKQ